MIRLALLLAGAMHCSACATTDKFTELKEAVGWGHEFFYASYSASGYALCDSELREYSAKAFERRFGNRFEKFREEHERRFGKPDSAIVVSTCRVWPKDRDYKIYHDQAMNEFEAWLDHAERRQKLSAQDGAALEQ